MTFFDILRLRGEFEILAMKFTGVNQNGTIEGLEAFLDNGHRKNRFRPGYERAREVAETILEALDEQTNLSGVRGG